MALTFGIALSQARRRAGKSQKALGAAVGVPQSTMSSWERGLTKPDSDKIFQMEDALNCPGSLSILLGYTRPYSGAKPPSITEAVAMDLELAPHKKKLFLEIYETVRAFDEPK